VQLAHPRDHHIAGLGVGAHDERRVLRGQVGQAAAQPIAVGPPGGGNGEVYHRRWELDRGEDDWAVLACEGVAGVGLAEAHRGAHLAGPQFIHRLAVVGMHPEQAADALPLAAAGVEDELPSPQNP